MSEAPLRETLLALEQRLLHGDPYEAGDLLEPDFEEVGPDGGITDREQVLAWLRSKPTSQRWEFLEFRVQRLTADIALARYRARRVGPAQDQQAKPVEQPRNAGSRRLSVWRRVPGSDHWRLCFHQATRLTAVDGG